MTTGIDAGGGRGVLGVLGIGTLGAAVARLAVDGGWDVVVANSRPAWTAWPVAAALGPAARAADAEEAARAGDVVLLAAPWGAAAALPRRALAGRTVIDAMNWFADRDGDRPGPEASSVLVQRLLPDSRVVKAFNSISFPSLRLLGRPGDAADRSALPVAGDDRQAVEAVHGFVRSTGFDPLDAGGLADSWRFEPGTPAFVRAYAPDGDVTRPVPAPAARIARLLEEAAPRAGAASAAPG